jgi:hypothetical protein
MKITDYVADSIDRLPMGYVFTCADLMVKVKSKVAAIKALSRMVSSGKISVLSKGKYF